MRHQIIVMRTNLSSKLSFGESLWHFGLSGSNDDASLSSFHASKLLNFLT